MTSTIGARLRKQLLSFRQWRVASLLLATAMWGVLCLLITLSPLSRLAVGSLGFTLVGAVALIADERGWAWMGTLAAGATVGCVLLLGGP